MVNCKNFDPKVEIEHIVDNIKAYFATNGDENTKAIIGISGGKDSTIAAALLVRALGPDRVIGVMMPDGAQPDIKDSFKVCDILGIPNYYIEIENIISATYNAVGNDCFNNNTVKTNTPARIRMSVLYAMAGLYHGRVINTGNASERFVGYATKYGDLAGDYALFKHYFVREIYAIGDALEELPYELVHKTPADGMSGMSDEEKLGFTYQQVDEFALDDVIPDVVVLQKIIDAHNRNLHKNFIDMPAVCPKTRYLLHDYKWGRINYGNQTESCCEWNF